MEEFKGVLIVQTESEEVHTSYIFDSYQMMANAIEVLDPFQR